MDNVKKYYRVDRLATTFSKMASLLFICSYLMVIVPTISSVVFAVLVVFMFVLVIFWFLIGIFLLGIPFLDPNYRSFGKKFLNFSDSATLQSFYDFFNGISGYIKYISIAACALFLLSFFILLKENVNRKRKIYNLVGMILTFILFIVSLVVNFSWHV